MNPYLALWASTLTSRRNVRRCGTFRRSDNASPTVRQKQNSNSLPLTFCAAHPFPQHTSKNENLLVLSTHTAHSATTQAQHPQCWHHNGCLPGPAL